MIRSNVFIALIFLIFIGALAVRLARLDERPMHVDEAVQAVKTGTLYDTGVYKYDPHEHHGPTLYYFAALSMKLAGCENFPASTEKMYRIVPVLFGAAVVLLLLFFGDGMGKPAALCAGVLFAISPAMVFYSRYYIQEMLLVFFTLAALGAFWRYVQNPSGKWAAIAGVAAGLMHATKETCVIAFAGMFVGAGVSYAMSRSEKNKWRRFVQPKHVLICAGAAIAVSVIWFSSFFSNASGPLDSLRTYANYLHRAGGEGSSGPHDHPVSYYLSLLLYSKDGRGPVFSEALIVALAVIGLIAGLLNKGISGASAGFVRFAGVYTVFVAAFYSLIAYKTPWCLLTFFSGMILLAAVGAVALVNVFNALPLKIVSTAVLLVPLAHLGWQSYLVNFKFYDDTRNPYVYAHTVSDLLKLPRRVDEIAAIHPDKNNLVIKVCTPDYWPLPWYLRKYPRVGYWTTPPEKADSPIVITSSALENDLNAKLRDEYQKEFYASRPNVFLKLFVEKSLWDSYLRGRAERKG